MIHAIQLDKQTGDITAPSDTVYNAEQSYNDIYIVITDNTDSPAYIYEHAEENGLPVYGDELTVKSGEGTTTIPVDNINIERRDENNMKAVPSYGLPTKAEGSYALWNYTVDYRKPADSGGGGGGFNKKEQEESKEDISKIPPWDRKYATECSIAPKIYKEVTNIGATVAPGLKTVVKNAAGDTIFREVELRNFVLSFTFAVRTFFYDYITDYINTVNSSSIVVAGVKIPSMKGVITNITSANDVWEDETVYTKVSVEIEIEYEKPVLYTEIVGTGFRAVPEEGGGGITGKAYPIHEFTGTALEYTKLDAKSVVWLDKKRGLGSFGSATIAGQPILGMYQNIDERKVLDKNGRIYQSDQVDLKDPNLNLIKIYEHGIKSWHGADFPKKGL